MNNAETSPTPRARPDELGAYLLPVLYVTRRSVYKTLADAWDIDRDARQWDGPGPCLAHPPCGHWGRYWNRCRKPGRDCGPIAFCQVRTHGGVIEHPASSLLWPHVLAPRPNEGLDLWGGRTIAIEQADWGHPSRKPTWLYIVGATTEPARPPGLRPATLKPVETLNAYARERTPPELAKWLLALTRSC